MRIMCVCERMFVRVCVVQGCPSSTFFAACHALDAGAQAKRRCVWGNTGPLPGFYHRLHSVPICLLKPTFLQSTFWV